jgi:hypothetical protein
MVCAECGRLVALDDDAPQPVNNTPTNNPTTDNNTWAHLERDMVFLLWLCQTTARTHQHQRPRTDPRWCGYPKRRSGCPLGFLHY